MENTNSKFVYIETYGCQMNVSDSEVIASILEDNNYSVTKNVSCADLILINTCAIRDNAEQRVWGRLLVLAKEKKNKPYLRIGVLGCMATRLKEKWLEARMVDFVVGPDEYRKLPQLLGEVAEGEKTVNVLLSREETYSDISPVRYLSNGVSAFVSIARGCNNVCSYCVVPYTRGVERSRNPESIIKEVTELLSLNYKEVTLLGQNVDSYSWVSEDGQVKVNFANLLEEVAKIDSLLRVRFATSHPKDMNQNVIEVMAKYPNICKSIHIPAQSGNDRILSLMRRGYTREEYLDRIKMIRSIIPNVSLSTDIIVGFCSETVEEHLDTLSLLKEVQYDAVFNFAYSERPNTKAARHYPDDISEVEKQRRLSEIISEQQQYSLLLNKAEVGKVVEVLIEGESKKSSEEYFGRTSQNKVVVFPKEDLRIGDYVMVQITTCTSATLIGKRIE